ncbi:MAG: lipocalin-like domain-containing protein [Desulfobacterales bacterium]|nr:lipocalin-like domain-containing protein [Desulfobacterales bacterium]
MKQKNLTDLSGTWKLVSFELRLSGEKKIYPFGEKAKGLLIYTKGGYMSGKLMPAERTHFVSPDPFKGTPAEMKEAFSGFVGYYGTYEIDDVKSTVKHHVEGSLFPNWEGQVQERFFKLNGNLLTLSTPPMPYENESAVAVLIWEKIE